MIRTKVWVVMSNDFPDSVFATAETAESYVRRQMAKQKENKLTWDTPRIYYRSYEFELRA